MLDRQHLHLLAAPLISLVLLGAIWTERTLFRLPAADADAYHRRVHARAHEIPEHIGSWKAALAKPPAPARTPLANTVVQMRELEHVGTRESARLLIVLCHDVRDLEGYDPSTCYPAHGWASSVRNERTITIDGRGIPVSVYEFERETPTEGRSRMTVYSFFVRPDGRLVSGFGGVDEAESDPRWRPFGAGQIQVLLDASLSESRRDEVVRTLVAGIEPLIEAVRRGDER